MVRKRGESDRIVTMFEDHVRRFSAQLTSRGLVPEDIENLADDCDALVIAGMGGSALAGEILRDFAGELGLRLPVLLWQDYGFPEVAAWAKKPLVVAVSFSGGTKETLSAYEEAGKRGAPRAVVSGNPASELYKKAEKDRIPRVRFAGEEGLTPRTACGSMFYSVLILLSHAFGISAESYDSRIDAASLEAQGEHLAEKFEGRTPLVYTTHHYHALGPIWKLIFNETAKTPAFSHHLPGLAHGEIAGFSAGGEAFHALFLTDPDGRAERKESAERLRQVFKRLMPVEDIILQGKDPFEKLWKSVILAHWTGLYMAKQKKVDPMTSSLIAQVVKWQTR